MASSRLLADIKARFCHHVSPTESLNDVLAPRYTTREGNRRVKEAPYYSLSY